MSPWLLSDNRETVASVHCVAGSAKPKPSALTRSIWLVAACILALLSLGVSGPTLAACSPIDASGNATCSSGIYTDQVPRPPGTSPAPINFSQPTPNTQLSVTLVSGVNVTLVNPGIAVSLSNFNGGLAALSASGATINVTNPAAGEHGGLYVETAANPANITGSGQIDVAGGSRSHAIKAFVNGAAGPGDASVTYTGAGQATANTRGDVR